MRLNDSGLKDATLLGDTPVNDFRATYEVCGNKHTVYARNVLGPVIGLTLIKVYGTGGQANCTFDLNVKEDNGTYRNGTPYQRGCEVFFRVLVQFTGGGSVEKRAVREELDAQSQSETPARQA